MRNLRQKHGETPTQLGQMDHPLLNLWIICKGPTEYEFVTNKFLRVVLLKIRVFWKVMSCGLTNSYSCFK